jgi:hypothetical protein
MEDPNFKRTWTIGKLFESKEIQSNFNRYIKDYPLTEYKKTSNTTIKHLKSNIEEEIKTHYDDYSIKKEDFEGNSLNFLLLHEKLSKIMNNKDISGKSRIGKLKFEPYSLKSPFYAKLKALDFITNDVRSLNISSLKNKIAERLFVLHKPSNISWDDITSDGLNLESVYNKIKLHLENYPDAKRDSINKLFLPSSIIAKDFYTKLITLNLTSKTALSAIGAIKIQTLLNSLEKVVDVTPTKDNSITREDLIGED